MSVADDGKDANHAFALAATLEEQRAAADQERIGPRLDRARKGCIDLAMPEKTVLFDHLVG